MTSNRFGNLFGGGDDQHEGRILSRATELTIKLRKLEGFTDDDGEVIEPGIFGSFRLTGKIGGLEESAKPEDMAFVRLLLARFESAVES